MSLSAPSGVCRVNRWTRTAEQHRENFYYEALAFSRHDINLEFAEENLKPKVLQAPGNCDPQSDCSSKTLARVAGSIPVVPDFQCAWQLLVQSANPRANHSLRTMPPSSTTEHARAHDDGMWQTVETLLQQTPGTEAELAFARELATSVLGLFADVLSIIRERTPQVVEMVVHAMVGKQQTGYLGEFQEASGQGYGGALWPELLHGK